MEIQKPPYGSPCNGCGLCCQNEICPLGALVMPLAEAPCPMLERDGDAFVCGLVKNPAKYAPVRTSVHGAKAMSEAAGYGVGVGIGCDARMEDERDVVPPASYTMALTRIARNSRRTSKAIERLWANPR